MYNRESRDVLGEASEKDEQHRLFSNKRALGYATACLSPRSTQQNYYCDGCDSFFFYRDVFAEKNALLFLCCHP